MTKSAYTLHVLISSYEQCVLKFKDKEKYYRRLSKSFSPVSLSTVNNFVSHKGVRGMRTHPPPPSPRRQKMSASWWDRKIFKTIGDGIVDNFSAFTAFENLKFQNFSRGAYPGPPWKPCVFHICMAHHSYLSLIIWSRFLRYAPPPPLPPYKNPGYGLVIHLLYSKNEKKVNTLGNFSALADDIPGCFLNEWPSRLMADKYC